MIEKAIRRQPKKQANNQRNKVKNETNRLKKIEKNMYVYPFNINFFTV